MDTQLVLSLIFLFLAIIMLILSIILFFKYDILDIFDTLTGAKKRRNLNRMKTQELDYGLDDIMTSGLTNNLDSQLSASKDKFIHDELVKVEQELNQSNLSESIIKDMDSIDKTEFLDNKKNKKVRNKGVKGTQKRPVVDKTEIISEKTNDKTEIISEEVSDKTEIISEEVSDTTQLITEVTKEDKTTILEETHLVDMSKPEIFNDITEVIDIQDELDKTDFLDSDLGIVEDNDHTEMLDKTLSKESKSDKVSTHKYNKTNSPSNVGGSDATSDLLEEQNNSSSINILSIED